MKNINEKNASRYIGLIIATTMVLATIVVLFADCLISPSIGLSLLIPSGTAFLAAIFYGIKSEYDKSQTIHPTHETVQNHRLIPIRNRSAQHYLYTAQSKNDYDYLN